MPSLPSPRRFLLEAKSLELRLRDRVRLRDRISRLPQHFRQLLSRLRSRVVEFRRADKLVLGGLCALVAAAAVLTALPTLPAGAADSRARYGARPIGEDWADDQSPLPNSSGSPEAGTPADWTPNASVGPDLVIDNAFADPPATPQKRTGFEWYVVKTGDSISAPSCRWPPWLVV